MLTYVVNVVEPTGSWVTASQTTEFSPTGCCSSFLFLSICTQGTNWHFFHSLFTGCRSHQRNGGRASGGAKQTGCLCCKYACHVDMVGVEARQRWDSGAYSQPPLDKEGKFLAQYASFVSARTGRALCALLGPVALWGLSGLHPLPELGPKS